MFACLATSAAQLDDERVVGIGLAQKFQELRFDGARLGFLLVSPMEACQVRIRAKPPVRCIPDRHSNAIGDCLLESGDGLWDVADRFQGRCKPHRRILTLRSAWTEHRRRATPSPGHRLAKDDRSCGGASSCQFERARIGRIKGSN